MILPVSSCYHNHSFLHFRLTSNKRGRGGASVREGYSQWLARGRKTHPCLETLKDGFYVWKRRVRCKPCCQNQGRGKGGGTLQQSHVHYYTSYNADTNRNTSENIRHLLGVFHTAMLWVKRNVTAVN